MPPKFPTTPSPQNPKLRTFRKAPNRESPPGQGKSLRSQESRGSECYEILSRKKAIWRSDSKAWSWVERITGLEIFSWRGRDRKKRSCKQWTQRRLWNPPSSPVIAFYSISTRDVGTAYSWEKSPSPWIGKDEKCVDAAVAGPFRIDIESKGWWWYSSSTLGVCVWDLTSKPGFVRTDRH